MKPLYYYLTCFFLLLDVNPCMSFKAIEQYVVIGNKAKLVFKIMQLIYCMTSCCHGNNCR